MLVCGWTAGLQEPEALQQLLELMASQELEIYQVGLAVNNPRNDSEEVIWQVKDLH